MDGLRMATTYGAKLNCTDDRLEKEYLKKQFCSEHESRTQIPPKSALSGISISMNNYTIAVISA